MRDLGVVGVVLRSFVDACLVGSNDMCSLKLQLVCMILVWLVLCYDRSATHVSVLAMSCFVEATKLLCVFCVVGVVLCLLGAPCVVVSHGVFSLNLRPV